MVSYTMTGQLSGAFTEFVLPSLTRFLSKEVVKVQEKRSHHRGDKERDTVEADDPDEKEWLDRIREESQLPAYDVSIDHLEMCCQFGYAVLWSSIWTLAPLMSWVNNLVSTICLPATFLPCDAYHSFNSLIQRQFEIRTDAFKLLYQTRRPVPSRSDTIGPWLSVLSFLAYLSALTNASLVYLLRPQLLSTSSASVSSSALLSNATMATMKNATEAIYVSNVELTHLGAISPSDVLDHFGLRALGFLGVVAYSFVIVRGAVKYALREQGKSSRGEREVRREAIRLRREFLGLLHEREGESVVRELSMDDMESDSVGVWSEGQRDRGAEEISRRCKTD